MKKKLKALLCVLALVQDWRPLTNNIPKCLVEISGKPLLEIWLTELERIGVEEVLINTHHLADQVILFLENWKSKNLKVFTTFEEELLGTAGTLLFNKNFFKNSTCIFMHADNFTNYDMNLLLQAHYKRNKGCLITMLTFKTSEPENCGVVEVDKLNIVRGFYEKVKNPQAK